MNNANDSPDDEEQLATPINDYRALLEMTRALVIAEDTGPSLQVPIQGNEATSPETEDSRKESALRRGEIVYPDQSGQRAATDEGPADDSSQTDSGLSFRIYLGMS
ncbi:MAG: hypothetical protein ACXQTH_03185 [Dehalococcoidia bacterium]